MYKLLEISDLKNYLYVSNSNIHGKGLFTKIDIPKDTRIMLVGNYEHYYNAPFSVLTYFAKCINHKIQANCIVKFLNKNLAYLYANKDI